MSNISTWSTSAASNNDAPPDGWPEGQAPSTVNDCGREVMGAVRRWYNDAEWIDWGDVLVRQSNNSFLVSRTATNFYTAGRRLKLYQATTVYGEVIASSPSGANTLVTVSSSNLTSSLSSGAVGILNPQFLSIPSAVRLREDSSWPILISGTEVDTSTGATTYDVTGIPSWVKRITISFVAFGTDGSSIPIIQIGDSGGIETSGYVSTGGLMGSTVANQTTGFALSGSWVTTNSVRGHCVLVLEDSSQNAWVMSSVISNNAVTPSIMLGSGSKNLSATLDRIRLTTVGGTDTGDSGIFNIIYE